MSRGGDSLFLFPAGFGCRFRHDIDCQEFAFEVKALERDGGRIGGGEKWVVALVPAPVSLDVEIAALMAEKSTEPMPVTFMAWPGARPTAGMSAE